MTWFILLFLFGHGALSQTYSIFPAGSCRPQQCTTHSPYVLTPSDKWNSSSICFIINQKSCNTTEEQCCTILRNRLQKIVIKTSPNCRGSYEQVTIDGVRKGGGVEFRDYDGFSELVISSLRMNESSALGRELCIFLNDLCATIDSFCGLNNTCVYSIYDPFTHNCCPRCRFATKNTNSSSPPFLEPSESLSANLPPPSPDVSFPPSEPPCNEESPPESLSANLPPPPDVPPPFPDPPKSLSANLPPPSVDQLVLSIKAPTKDVKLVQKTLCPLLVNTYTSNCKIQFQAANAIYYGGDLILTYDQIRQTLQQNINVFTDTMNLLCDGTVLVYKDDTALLRYTTSSTCKITP